MVTPLRMPRPDREAVLARVRLAFVGRTDVLFATVHGSFLNADAFRDLDLAIWTSPGADPGLDVQLAAQLSLAIGLPVDVRRMNDAPVSFLFHALRGRVVFSSDELALAAVMERVAREYHDMAPVLRRATKDAFAR
jgi:predicted nucleotidyltransferase